MCIRDRQLQVRLCRRPRNKSSCLYDRTYVSSKIQMTNLVEFMEGEDEPIFESKRCKECKEVLPFTSFKPRNATKKEVELLNTCTDCKDKHDKVVRLFKKYNPKRLIIFSRDEMKQFEMSQIYNPVKFPCLRYFLGDVRDRNRLDQALKGVDYVIHAAALKQVPNCEFFPMEAVKTNILGAANVIDAAIDNDVDKVIALSTDKASSPINLYGASKLASDKLFVAANNIKGSKNKKFSVVRYGNVLGSRGSVIPLFIEKAKTGLIPITSKEMTRFNITLDKAIDMVFWCMENSCGGELFIPKIPSYRITDLAEAIAPSCKQEIIGIRPGEKIHEEMISSADSLNTYEYEKHYLVLPASSSNIVNKFQKHSLNFHPSPLPKDRGWYPHCLLYTSDAADE